MRVPVTQQLRPSPAGRVGPGGAGGDGGPRDVTSLSLSKQLAGMRRAASPPERLRQLVPAPQQEKIHMLTLPHPYLAARSAFAGTQLYPSSSSHMTS